MDNYEKICSCITIDARKKIKNHKVLFITIPHLKLHFVEAQKEEKMLKQASFFETC